MPTAAVPTEELDRGNKKTQPGATKTKVTPNAKQRKRKLNDGSPSTIQNKTKALKQGHQMECGRSCSRCNTEINSLSLRCASCERTLHVACRTRDELEPSEDPRATWNCRVCLTPLARRSSDEMMLFLDKQPLESELMNYVAFLVTKIRKLEAKVAALSELRTEQCEVIRQEPMDEVPEAENKQVKGTFSKSVLLIGDAPTEQLKRKVLSQLPRKTPIVIRAYRKRDTKAILEHAETFLSTNPQPVHIILHSGYNECMEFEKEKFLLAIDEFSKRLKERRPECSMSVITVPQFIGECKEANTLLREKQKSADICVIESTESHRMMVNRGLYTYAGIEDLLITCSKAIARKAADFLEVKTVNLPPRPTIERNQEAKRTQGGTRRSRQEEQLPQPTRRDPTRNSERPPIRGRQTDAGNQRNKYRESRQTNREARSQPTERAQRHNPKHNPKLLSIADMMSEAFDEISRSRRRENTQRGRKDRS